MGCGSVLMSQMIEKRDNAGNDSPNTPVWHIKASRRTTEILGVSGDVMTHSVAPQRGTTLSQLLLYISQGLR